MSMSADPSLYGAGGSLDDTLSALATLMRTECRLLGELIGAMRRQRDAIAADDLQGVEESVFATHRVLHTLGEAQRRRRSISRLLGATEDLPIRELERLIPGPMPDELRAARDELESVAHALAAEVDVNRKILRNALAKGEDYMRTLGGVPENRLNYTADARRAEPVRTGGFLVDRVV
jgi:hypothetical protein